MKKQILSIMLLACFVSSSAFALEQTGVADNITGKQKTAASAEEDNSNPWEQCSQDELMQGCVKDYVAMTMNLQSLPLNKDQKINIESRGDSYCTSMMQLIRASDNFPIDIGYGIDVYDGGDYYIRNNAPMTCTLRLQIQPR